MLAVAEQMLGRKLYERRNFAGETIGDSFPLSPFLLAYKGFDGDYACIELFHPATSYCSPDILISLGCAPSGY